MTKRRLGHSTLAVLSAVTQGHRYGFEIMDETELQSGTVYRALSRLEDLGLVRSRWEPAKQALDAKRPRRRYYEVSDAGRRELADARERARAFVRGLAVNENRG